MRRVLGLLMATVVALPALAQAQTYTLAPAFAQQFFDNSGRPLNGGKCYFYVSGTTTPQDTYQNVGGTLNANPVILDSAGRPTSGGSVIGIYFSQASYKVICQTSASVTVFTRDGVAAVPDFNVSAIAGPCNGRLSALTGDPAPSTDVSAATSVYFIPYQGNECWTYDGASAWTRHSFAQIATSISTCTASRPHDVFIYNNAGTLTAEILAWTNATTRATALTTQDNVYVKSGATTRRYVGTFYCNASGGQTDDTFAKRNVWSYYNRTIRPLRKNSGTATWTYTTATVRQAAADTANQVELTVGVNETTVFVEVRGLASNTNTGVEVAVGIGVSSTTTISNTSAGGVATITTASSLTPVSASQVYRGSVGFQTLVWLEWSEATGTTTWYGTAPSAGPANVGHGLVGWVEG